MHYELERVTKGRADLALPPTTLRVDTGAVTVHGIATQQGPSVLSLVAAGRMRPSSGTVRCVTSDGHHLTGRAARQHVRRRMALVDTPRVCEPVETMRVRDIAREELAFSGHCATASAADRVLDELDLREDADAPIGLLHPAARLRLLTELTLRRPGVAGVVLTTPDRHGGDAAQWRAYARELAERGAAVLVVTGETAARSGLDAPAARG